MDGWTDGRTDGWTDGRAGAGGCASGRRQSTGEGAGGGEPSAVVLALMPGMRFEVRRGDAPRWVVATIEAVDDGGGDADAAAARAAALEAAAAADPTAAAAVAATPQERDAPFFAVRYRCHTLGEF